MSMFGLGSKPNNEAANAAKIQEAEAELDMISDMFNRLIESCHKKCLDTRYYDSSISSKEGLCIDRCVSKYFEVNTKIGENMQQMGQQFMQQR